jgi:hypothetical protein
VNERVYRSSPRLPKLDVGAVFGIAEAELDEIYEAIADMIRGRMASLRDANIKTTLEEPEQPQVGNRTMCAAD